jgi:hypothetical protein
MQGAPSVGQGSAACVRGAEEEHMTDVTELAEVEVLLVACEQGAPLVRLDGHLERLAARALESNEKRALRLALRCLRVEEAGYREDGREVPPRLVKLLADARAALKGQR